MTPPGARGSNGPGLGYNTFAVPVLTGAPRRRRVEWRAQGPLVPWQVAGAEELWVPVDDTQKQFERFVDEGPQPELIIDPAHNAGFLVVVSGAAKSGKTTFVHKSVHDLAQRLEEELTGESAAAREKPEPWTLRGSLPSPVRVIPLGGQTNDMEAIGWQDGAPASLDVLNQRILEKVRTVLGGEFPAAAVGLCNERKFFEAYNLLSDSLANLGRVLLIVLPDFHWNDERLTRRFYKSCHNNARTGIVFFCESSTSTVGHDLTEDFDLDLARFHIIHLEIGRLRSDDWVRFVEARHGTATIPGPHVRLADDVLDGELDGWIRKDIGTLQRILCDAAQQAYENEENEIDMERLRLYTRDHRRSGPEDFRRPSA